jgi:hypothetical protein
MAEDRGGAGQEAALRHMEFQIAIFGDPLYT